MALPEGWTEVAKYTWGYHKLYKHTDGREQKEDPSQPLGVIAISDAITTNGALVKFAISKNWLRAQGAKALAEALKGNQVMQELDIADNRLCGSWIEYIWINSKGRNPTISDRRCVERGSFDASGELTD